MEAGFSQIQSQIQKRSYRMGINLHGVQIFVNFVRSLIVHITQKYKPTKSSYNYIYLPKPQKLKPLKLTTVTGHS